MRVSFVATVFNEEKTINQFLKSIFAQSKVPDEIIIVDGGSTDATVSKISSFKFPVGDEEFRIKLIFKKGNRSVGRNEAIKRATGEIIACSDAGCVLDKDWLEKIIEPFRDKKIDVVSGYYRGKNETVFQRCLVPYVLVMEDRVNSAEFLPASRSMAFRKSIWKKVGGFDERYSHNEDYVFAQELKKNGTNIVFQKNAIVNWIPRSNFKDAFKMFFRFAFGDSESGLFRDKVILLFIRYFFAFYILWLAFVEKSLILFFAIILGALIYILWSIMKNYKYVDARKAFFILPIIQFTSDIAILLGTSFGSVKSIFKINYLKIFKNNLGLTIPLVIYIITMLLVIRSGIPNQSHPFPYHMDEWHQLQAVRNVFRYGSPNLSGSANGTMFHFLISGILMIPFYIAGIINPFTIKSSIDSLLDQEKLFIVLRLTTLFFGALTLVTLSKFAKLLGIKPFLVVVLFIFTPVWLILSNFFKYDIGLTFWIALSFLYFIKYSFSSSLKHFLVGCFFSGLAFSVKVSALPLLPIILITYFLFTPAFNKKYSYLLIGVLIFIFNSMFLGIPDVIFGGRNMYEYLNDNITGASKIIGNYNLGGTLLNMTLLHKLPAIFGHSLYFFSVLSLFYIIILTFIDFKNKNFVQFKIKLFIALSFIIFSLSLVPLGITISANRSVVLLPFITLIDGIVVMNLFNILKNKHFTKALISTFLVIIVLVQILESYLWIYLKIKPSPQQLSSKWVIENIQKNSNIGLENIPIYQFEPDFVLKEFYSKLYNPNIKTEYNYFVIDKTKNELPAYIIVSNANYEKRFLKRSPKNELLDRITNEGYKQIAYFPLEVPLYKNFDDYFYYPYVGLFAFPDGISIFEKKK